MQPTDDQQQLAVVLGCWTAERARQLLDSLDVKRVGAVLGRLEASRVPGFFGAHGFERKGRDVEIGSLVGITVGIVDDGVAGGRKVSADLHGERVCKGVALLIGGYSHIEDELVVLEPAVESKELIQVEADIGKTVLARGEATKKLEVS